MMNIEQVLNSMTLDEKIGQMFLLAFSKDRLDEARVLFEDYFVGASYISNDNVPTPDQAAVLTRQLQACAGKTRLQIPLILGVDQEGTWGVMVPGSCTGPGNMALGAAANPDDAYQMYRVIGQELNAVGLNTLLAPCADCNSNPDNSVIGMRSFGEKASLVGALTAAAVRGAQAGGVIATVKHFPGHGDTRLDSHRGLPTVERSREELLAIDLAPFAQGIKAGADVVMTAHIIFSALDAENPATLSPVILGDVLRGEFGFQGVIMSDSMNMHSIKKNYESADAIVRAFQAGVDLLMLAEEHYDHNAETYLQEQTGLIRAVKRAVENGDLPMQRADESVRRVLALKAKYNLSLTPPLNVASVGSPANRAVELQVSRHAVAVMRDVHGHVPLDRSQPLTLVNTTTRSGYAILSHTRGIGPNQTTAAFDTVAEALLAQCPQAQVVTAEEMLKAGITALGGEGVIVAVTENYALPGVDFVQDSQRQIIKKLVATVAERLVVVALRDPYELADLPELPTYVCAFSFRPCAAQAAVEALLGDIQVVGATPVGIPNTNFSAKD